MKRKFYVKVAWLTCILVMTVCFSACGSKDTAMEPEQPSTTDSLLQEKTSDSAIYKSSVYPASSAEEAYLHILERYKDAINLPDGDGNKTNYIVDKNYDPSNDRVALCDITGDGIDELIFIMEEPEEMVWRAVPHVYTFDGEKAFEMKLSNNKMLDRAWEKDNELFAAVAAGGEQSAYYLMMLGDNGKIYIVDCMGSADTDYELETYNVSEDGMFNLERTVYNHSCYDDPNIDEYKVNGKTVSAKEGESEFRNMSDHYKSTLLYSGNLTYLSVMDKVTDETTLSMSCDDAMQELESKFRSE